MAGPFLRTAFLTKENVYTFSNSIHVTCIFYLEHY